MLLENFKFTIHPVLKFNLGKAKEVVQYEITINFVYFLIKQIKEQRARK